MASAPVLDLTTRVNLGPKDCLRRPSKAKPTKWGEGHPHPTPNSSYVQLYPRQKAQM